MQKLVIVLDCQDTEALARFWTGATGYRRTRADEPYVFLAPATPPGF